jgi:hypothetical protein
MKRRQRVFGALRLEVFRSASLPIWAVLGLAPRSRRVGSGSRQSKVNQISYPFAVDSRKSIVTIKSIR